MLQNGDEYLTINEQLMLSKPESEKVKEKIDPRELFNLIGIPGHMTGEVTPTPVFSAPENRKTAGATFQRGSTGRRKNCWWRAMQERVIKVAHPMRPAYSLKLMVSHQPLFISTDPYHTTYFSGIYIILKIN